LELLQANGFVRADNAGKSGVPFAISFPNFLFVPLIDKCEKFQEENAEVVTLTRGAAMNAGQNTLQNVCYRFKHVEIRYTMKVESL